LTASGQKRYAAASTANDERDIPEFPVAVGNDLKALLGVQSRIAAKKSIFSSEGWDTWRKIWVGTIKKMIF